MLLIKFPSQTYHSLTHGSFRRKRARILHLLSRLVKVIFNGLKCMHCAILFNMPLIVSSLFVAGTFRPLGGRDHSIQLGRAKPRFLCGHYQRSECGSFFDADDKIEGMQGQLFLVAAPANRKSFDCAKGERSTDENGMTSNQV
jgi:hypothetical protein